MRARSSARARPGTVDDYLATVGVGQGAALEKLRRIIRAAVPRAEECISYGIPAFRLDGKVLVWFAAAARHCSFFPGAVLAEFADELEDFETSKGTVRFQPDHMLPATLVRKLVKARMAKIGAGRAKPTGARPGGRLVVRGKRSRRERK